MESVVTTVAVVVGALASVHALMVLIRMVSLAAFKHGSPRKHAAAEVGSAARQLTKLVDTFEDVTGDKGHCIVLNFSDRVIEVHAADCPTSCEVRKAMPQGIMAKPEGVTMVGMGELPPELAEALGLKRPAPKRVDPSTLN